MQQASQDQVFTPPSVSSREFKRESLPPTEDYREHLLELEKEGELEVQRVPDLMSKWKPSSAESRRSRSR